MVGCFFFLEAENETINDSSPDVLSQVLVLPELNSTQHHNEKALVKIVSHKKISKMNFKDKTTSPFTVVHFLNLNL